MTNFTEIRLGNCMCRQSTLHVQAANIARHADKLQQHTEDNFNDMTGTSAALKPTQVQLHDSEIQTPNAGNAPCNSCYLQCRQVQIVHVSSTEYAAIKHDCLMLTLSPSGQSGFVEKHYEKL